MLYLGRNEPGCFWLLLNPPRPPPDQERHADTKCKHEKTKYQVSPFVSHDDPDYGKRAERGKKPHHDTLFKAHGNPPNVLFSAAALRQKLPVFRTSNMLSITHNYQKSIQINRLTR